VVAAKVFRQVIDTVLVPDAQTPAITHPVATFTPGLAITGLPVTIPVTVTVSVRVVLAAKDAGA
jgi:hypothetical protein